jgi:glucose-1-phosphate cytidylyltransferase
MRVVILCGGQGTRLREETEYRPKPLVEVGGRPILWHIMKTYSHYGFRDFVLCLGYRGNMIKDYFLNYEAMNNDFTVRLGKSSEIDFHGSHAEQGLRVTLADTGAETMTGGRIRRIQKYIEDDVFMVTYGDGVIDVDLRSVLDFHLSHGKLATVTSVHPAMRYGAIEIGGNRKVDRFAEKPTSQGWISAGYFIFNRKLFDYLDADECILERKPLEQLTAENQLMAYQHDGFFFAMDTYREYTELNEIWAGGRAPWKVWE